VATVTFDIPDELLAVLPCAPEEAGRAIRLAAAMHWCSRGELSVSLGAQLAGLTYAEFIAEAARRKFELFPLDIDELKQELAHLGTRNGGDIAQIKEELARDQSRRR